MSLYGDGNPQGNLRGQWARSVLYWTNDIVQDAGSQFQALKPNINVRPSTDTRGIWAFFGSGSALPAGVMLQSTYDPTGSGSVLKSSSAPWSGLVGVPPSISLPNPALGPVFYVGASYEDMLNYYVISGGGAPYPVSAYSDGPSWPYLVNSYLGQQCLGRYAGAAGSPTGQMYAVAGQGSFTGTYSIPNQIAKLIADYGGTLPAGSVVVIGGFWPNDINSTAIGTYGGIWAPPSGAQTWQVGLAGGFTVPGSGNINVPVVSSSGAAVSGTNNQIHFATATGAFNPATAIGPFVINSIPDGSHIQVATNAAFSGSVVPNNALIWQSAADYLAYITTTGGLATAVANLVAALPANGLLIICISPDISLLPIYAAFSQGLTNCHNSWLWYKTNIIAPLAPLTSPKIAVWDMSQVFVDICTNYPPTNGLPSKFGFKTVTAGLGGTYLVPVPSGRNAADYTYWDGTADTVATAIHPTGATHDFIAQAFFPFLKSRKQLSL